jgi:DNA-damage-inducible protein J
MVIPSTMVHVRVDEKVKEEASATLAKMGISVSDAVRMMLIRILRNKCWVPHSSPVLA